MQFGKHYDSYINLKFQKFGQRKVYLKYITSIALRSLWGLVND